MKKTITAISAAMILSLAFPLISFAEEEKEDAVKMSDVPAAVQKAGEAEAKGGKIVRWEKEGSHFEVVIEKGGKQTGVEMDAEGKVLSRHNEQKEHKEKDEKY